ncbi:hypothetical protein B0H10DRAFT_1956758 [Mycena sp. CBHHK59/15]|nr:hypothetical protein B0H10DRAFT_1956758 [Mycena sp. CBHHK59/15]
MKPQAKTRGPYYKTKISAAPAPRTERLHKANEKKTKKAHGVGLMSWVKKSTKRGEPPAGMSQTTDGMEIVTADMHQPINDAPSSSRRSPVTIKEVDDEGDPPRPVSPTPSELSRLEEDGLKDWEELFASISMEPSAHLPSPWATSPSAVPTSDSTAAGPSRPSGSVRLGPPEFSRTDETFQPTKSAPTPGTLRPPPPQEIDEAIQKIHAILRPSRGAKTKGYNHADLNMVLRGRLELMLAFLRLYAAEGYKEWGNTANIIAKSAGREQPTDRRVWEI